LDSAEEGLALMQRGLKTYQALKTPPIFFPLLLFLEAGAYGLAKRPQGGVEVLNRAINSMGEGSSQTYVAQFFVLKGQLLLQISADNVDEAESYFQRALNSALEIQAPMLELKAAMSLARLWHEQGKAEQGRDLLSRAYAKFTEGFTTPDLKEAQALLDDLAQPAPTLDVARS
jgi:predicted ATPase